MLRKLALTAMPALVIVGCTTTEIDAGKAESFLRDNVPGVRQASCPDGVEAKKDETFDCDLTYADGRRGKATVRIENDDGRVSIRPQDIKPAP